jgi:hypothetical protein
VTDRWRKVLTFVAAMLIAGLAIWNGRPLHPHATADAAHADAGDSAPSPDAPQPPR